MESEIIRVGHSKHLRLNRVELSLFACTDAAPGGIKFHSTIIFSHICVLASNWRLWSALNLYRALSMQMRVMRGMRGKVLWPNDRLLPGIGACNALRRRRITFLHSVHDCSIIFMISTDILLPFAVLPVRRIESMQQMQSTLLRNARCSLRTKSLM